MIRSRRLRERRRPRKPKGAVLIDGFHGIGDQIYQRPAVAACLREGLAVWLATPLPELYVDLVALGELHFVRPRRVTLRTQALEMARVPEALWKDWPPARSAERRRVAYTPAGIAAGMRPWECFAHELGFAPPEIDGRDMVIHVGSRRRADALAVHPPTLRREWKNPARLPAEGAFAAAVAAGALRTDRLVSVGFEAPGEEWKAEPETWPVAQRFDAGELGLGALLGLLRGVAGIVSGVSLMLPLAIATSTPALIVFGGSLPPEVLVPLEQDWNPITAVGPERVCDCGVTQHDCDKTTNLDALRSRSREWRASL